jgi:signal transduction histidine kinase
LKNAINYTHEGEIKIRAEVLNKKVSVKSREFINMIKIDVNDTGIGVSFEKQNNLFKPFFDSDRNCRTQVYGGVGIGLALSKGLVKNMGGEMIFYSLGEGLGSTVTFTIPMSDLLK